MAGTAVTGGMWLDRSLKTFHHRQRVIIHASKKFVKRFKCDVSLKGHRVLQPGRLDAWSAHLVRVGRPSLVLLMNDASLYSLIIPAKGLRSFAAFLRVALPEIANALERHGGFFDSNNTDVIVLARSSRSLIGSMNDAVRIIRFYHEDALAMGEESHLPMIQGKLNQNIYSAIDYEMPHERLERLLSSAD